MKALKELEKSEFEFSVYLDWVFDNYSLQEIIEFEDDDTVVVVAFSNFLNDSLPF